MKGTQRGVLKTIYTSNTPEHDEIRPKGDWRFPATKVGVWAKESLGFMPGNSERRKSTEKGSLRLP